MSTENRLSSQRTLKPYTIKVNNCRQVDFGDKNRVNWRNFDATVLSFFEEFDHQFSHVFIFGNMFPESHSYIAMPVTSRMEDTCSNLSLFN